MCTGKYKDSINVEIPEDFISGSDVPELGMYIAFNSLVKKLYSEEIHMRRKLIAGNWKMNLKISEARVYASEFISKYTPVENVEVAVCAPYTHLQTLKEGFKTTDVSVGAENVHFKDSGAYTGEVSPVVLKELGMDYCIVGHSERRQYFAETDETVNLKVRKLFETGITPIMCVGENLQQREAGAEKFIVGSQVREGLNGLSAEEISDIVIAYEPVWAIGTGRTATSNQAQDMCSYIRSVVKETAGADAASGVIILYGGSVKASNAAELMGMEDIDGALVGGASLKVDDFLGIVNFGK